MLLIQLQLELTLGAFNSMPWSDLSVQLGVVLDSIKGTQVWGLTALSEGFCIKC